MNVTPDRSRSRSTKIVATLGPASDSPDLVSRLLDEGVNVFRVNCSHGDWKQRLQLISRIRAASTAKCIQAGILLDLQGPKIRLGEFHGGKATLAAGTRFTISTEQVGEGNSEHAWTTYADFARDVKAGDPVLLADGSIELRALESDGTKVVCQVINGGEISDHKGINLPGVTLSTPSLTEKDTDDLAQGIDAGVDFVALSFVRTADDVRHLREVIAERGDARGKLIPIVAKIEKPEGFRNLEEILEVSDGVMVARGDLGVETTLERVPLMQKLIISRARIRDKFVITATQMLESMIDNPFPTRAEVSDIANAICDGTDAVMLSAETSIGRYPERAVRTMARVAEETESWLSNAFAEPPESAAPTNAEIIAQAAFHAAKSAGVAAIAIYTTTGLGARLIARYRPPVPVYAFTPSEIVARQLSAWFGVYPILSPTIRTTDEKLLHMEEQLLSSKHLQVNDNVVFVAGQPRGSISGIDLIKLHRLEHRA